MHTGLGMAFIGCLFSFLLCKCFLRGFLLQLSYALLHIDTPVLAGQQKLIFISSVQTLNVINKGCQEQWPIGMDDKTESRESMVSAHLDDECIFITINSDNEINLFLCSELINILVVFIFSSNNTFVIF